VIVLGILFLCVCIRNRLKMPIILNEQEKCAICTSKFKQSDFDSEAKMPTYVSDGGSGLSESCFHLFHFECIKEWYNVRQKHQEETWIRNTMEELGYGDEEEFRHDWNLHLIPYDRQADYDKHVELVACPLCRQKFIAFHRYDFRKHRCVNACLEGKFISFHEIHFGRDLCVCERVRVITRFIFLSSRCSSSSLSCMPLHVILLLSLQRHWLQM
jgi:uncharacterized protein YbaR (Trm112 family)